MHIHNDGHFNLNNSGKGKPGEFLYKLWLKSQGTSYVDKSNDRECQKQGFDLLVGEKNRKYEIKTNYKFDLRPDLVFIEDWSQIKPTKKHYAECATKGCHSTFCQSFPSCYDYAVKGWWYTTEADVLVFMDKWYQEFIEVPLTVANTIIYEDTKKLYKIKYQNNWSRNNKELLAFKSAGRLYNVNEFKGIKRISLYTGEH